MEVEVKMEVEVEIVINKDFDLCIMRVDCYNDN